MKVRNLKSKSSFYIDVDSEDIDKMKVRNLNLNHHFILMLTART